jgi:hypothetical protein
VVVPAERRIQVVSGRVDLASARVEQRAEGKKSRLIASFGHTLPLQVAFRSERPATSDPLSPGAIRLRQ